VRTILSGDTGVRRGLDVVLTTAVQIGLNGYQRRDGVDARRQRFINGYLAELGALSRRFRIYRRSL
jgi:hypothetical protein